MKHPEHFILSHEARLHNKHHDESQEGSRAVSGEDETRENWSPLSTVNILGVTNLDQFSTVQYSALPTSSMELL